MAILLIVFASASIPAFFFVKYGRYRAVVAATTAEVAPAPESENVIKVARDLDGSSLIAYDRFRRWPNGSRYRIAVRRKCHRQQKASLQEEDGEGCHGVELLSKTE
jgi:hypothetical protein